MQRFVMIVTSVAVLLTTLDVSAAGRRQQRMLERTTGAESPPLATPGRLPPSATDSGRYPKYIGGFHSRELQNIGIPNGDQGLRGNGGLSIYPW